MGYARDITPQLARVGHEVSVFERQVTGTNSLGNPTDDYVEQDEQVICFRTYPNRNTQVKGTGGDRDRDNPLLVFPAGDEPPESARVKYPEVDGSLTTYEVQAPTKYETHTEMFAEVVVND